MFCKKCGNKIEGSLKFCPKCGTPTPAQQPRQQAQSQQQVQSQQQAQSRQQQPQQQPRQAAYSGAQGQGQQRQGQAPYTPPRPNPTPAPNPYRSAPTPAPAPVLPPVKPAKKSHKGRVAFCCVAGVVVIAVAGGLIVNSILGRPLTALALGTGNLAEDLSKMESGTISVDFTSDGETVAMDIDFELNEKDHEFYAYGNLSSDEEGEIAIGIEEDYGVMCFYSSEYGNETETIDADMLEEVWDAVDDASDGNTKLEDQSIQEILEDSGYADDLSPYLDLDEVDSSYEKIVKKLASNGTQKDLVKALDIDSSGFLTKTYTMDLKTDNLIDGCQTVLEVVEEEGSDAIKGDWLDDAIDYLDDDALSDIGYELGGADDFGTLEWRAKFGTLQSISYDASFGGVDISAGVSMDYGFLNSLKGVEFSMDFSDYYDSVKGSVSLNNINKIHNVKSSIPEDMLEAMDLD